MEIFGGFMVMISILGFFLAVIWFVLPFVIFSMKGTQDRSFLLLEELKEKLKTIEMRLQELERSQSTSTERANMPDNPSCVAPPPSAEE